MATVAEQSVPSILKVSEAAQPDAAAMSLLQQNGDKLAAIEEADVPQKKYGDIIVVKRSGRDGSRFPILSNTNITIGRSENCNIRVVLETVSEEHVIISIDEGKKLVVKNLAKMGGSTFLNKVLMLPNETTGLYAGDVIGVCDREFRIELTSTEKTPGKSRALAPRKERAFSTASKSPAQIRKMSGTKRSFSSSPSRVLAVIGEASQSPARMTIRSPGRAMAHSSTKAARPPPSKIPTKQRSASMQQPFRLGLPRPNIDPFASPSLQESFKKWKTESPRKSVQSTPKEASDQQSYLIDMDKEVSPLTGQSRQSVRIRNLLDATLTPAGLGHSGRLSVVEKTASSPVGEKTPIRAEIVDTIPETAEYDSDQAVDDSMGIELDDQVFAEDGEDGQPRQSVRIRNLLDATLTPAGLGHSSRLSIVEKTASSPVGEITPMRAEIAEHDSDRAVDENSECVPPTPTSSLPPFSTAVVAVQVAEVHAIVSKEAIGGSPALAGPGPSSAPRRRSSRLSSSQESTESGVFEVTPVRTEAASIIVGDENERDLPKLDDTSDCVPPTPTVALPHISTVAAPSPEVAKDQEKAASVTPGPGSSKKPNRRSNRLTSPKETSGRDVEETLVGTEAANQSATRNEDEHSLPQLDETNDYVPSTPTMLLPPFSAVALPSVVNEKDNEKEVGVSPSLADVPLIPARRSNRLSTPKDTNSVDVNEETLVEQKKKTPNKKTPNKKSPLLARPSSSRRSTARKESPNELMSTSPHVVVQSTPKVASDHQDQDHLIDMDKEVSPLTGQPRQSVQIRNLLDATLTPAGFGRSSRLSVIEKTGSPVGEKTPMRAEIADTIPETSEHDSDQAVDGSMGTEVDEQVIAAEDGEDGGQVPQLDETKERIPLTPTVAALSPVSTVVVPTAENAKDEEEEVSVSPHQSGASQTPNRRSNRMHSPKATSNIDEQTKKTPNTPSPLVVRRSGTDEQTKKTPNTPSPLVVRRSNIDEQTKKTPSIPSPLPTRRSSSKRSSVLDAAPSAHPASPGDVHEEEEEHEELTHNISQPSFTPPKSPRVPVKSVLRLARVAASDSDSSMDSKRKVVFTPEPAVKFIPRIGTKSVRETERLENEEKKAAAKRAADTLEAQLTEEAGTLSPVKKSAAPQTPDVVPTTETMNASARRTSMRNKSATAVRKSPEKKPAKTTSRKKNTTEDAVPSPSLETTAVVEAHTPPTKATRKKAATSAVSAKTAKKTIGEKTKPATRKTAAQKTVAVAVVDDHSPPAATKGAATRRNKQNVQLAVLDKEEHDASPPKRSRRSAKKEVSEAVEAEPAAPSTAKPRAKKTADKETKKTTRKAATKTEAATLLPAKKVPAARRTKQNSETDAEDGSSPRKRGRPSGKNANAVEAETKTTKKAVAKKAAPKKVTVEAPPQAETVVKRGTKRTKQPAEVTVEPSTEQAEAVATKTSKKPVAKKAASKKVTVETPPPAETVVKRVTKRGKQPAEVVVEPPTKSVRGRKAAAAAQV